MLTTPFDPRVDAKWAARNQLPVLLIVKFVFVSDLGSGEEVRAEDGSPPVRVRKSTTVLEVKLTRTELDVVNGV